MHQQAREKERAQMTPVLWAPVAERPSSKSDWFQSVTCATSMTVGTTRSVLMMPPDWIAAASRCSGQFVYITVGNHDASAPVTQATGGAQAGVSHEYDPEFIASILQADTAPAEASFNNVVDMLGWLNRD